MKFMIALMAVGFLGLQVQGSTFKCFGVQDNRGARGKISIDENLNYVFSGSEMEGTDRQPLNCSGLFDKNYRPRNPDPQMDRYTTDEECGNNTAWISKSLLTEGKGFVNFTRPCGMHNDVCETSYLCASK